MGHVVLLGDSIFDNARYVPGGPDVVHQLRAALPPGWRATLLAVDGAVTKEVLRQLAKLPADATHLVVSAGGNDALDSSSLVKRTCPAYEAFVEMAEIRERFRRDYREMLRTAAATGKPVAVCTVYDAIPVLSRPEAAGLAVFNDAIVREAVAAGVPVLDLRQVCDEAADYSPLSPIEPSHGGGAKIAGAVAHLVTTHDFAAPGTAVYGRRES
jgi:hypothetical protein